MAGFDQVVAARAQAVTAHGNRLGPDQLGSTADRLVLKIAEIRQLIERLDRSLFRPRPEQVQPSNQPVAESNPPIEQSLDVASIGIDAIHHDLMSILDRI